MLVLIEKHLFAFSLLTHTIATEYLGEKGAQFIPVTFYLNYLLSTNHGFDNKDFDYDENLII